MSVLGKFSAVKFKSMECSIDMDATDLRILDQLQRDASLSNQDLAAATHTSAATCLRRVKRLVDSGVIERCSSATAFRRAPT